MDKRWLVVSSGIVVLGATLLARIAAAATVQLRVQPVRSDSIRQAILQLDQVPALSGIRLSVGAPGSARQSTYALSEGDFAALASTIPFLDLSPYLVANRFQDPAYARLLDAFRLNGRLYMLPFAMEPEVVF